MKNGAVAHFDRNPSLDRHGVWIRRRGLLRNDRQTDKCGGQETSVND
jgi:hypothetical protein